MSEHTYTVISINRSGEEDTVDVTAEHIDVDRGSYIFSNGHSIESYVVAVFPMDLVIRIGRKAEDELVASDAKIAAEKEERAEVVLADTIVIRDNGVTIDGEEFAYHLADEPITYTETDGGFPAVVTLKVYAEHVVVTPSGSLAVTTTHQVAQRR